MRYFPTEAHVLAESDMLRDGRVVTTVEPANEWAGVEPIGYASKVVVTFADGSEDTFDRYETLLVVIA